MNGQKILACEDVIQLYKVKIKTKENAKPYLKKIIELADGKEKGVKSGSWIVNFPGNDGNTSVTEFLESSCPEKYLCISAEEEGSLLQTINRKDISGWSGHTLVIYIPMSVDVSDDLFESIESIRDGYQTAGLCGSDFFITGDNADRNVIVLSHDYPNLKNVSDLKWNLYAVLNDDLIDVTDIIIENTK